MAEEDETIEDEQSSNIENEEDTEGEIENSETSSEKSASDGESSSLEDSDIETEMLAALEDAGESGISDAVNDALTDEDHAAFDRSAMPVNVARLMDVDLNVTIELGRSRQTMQSVLSLGEQSVVELDKQVGESVDVLVNGKLFARGEVVTVSENFGVRITEILGNVADL